MTLEEARKVLGMGPDEEPSSHLEEFAAAREQLASMVRDAPNDTIALRYQDSLQEFDRALAALREEGDRLRKAKMAAMMALVPSAVTGEHISTKREGFLDEAPVPEAEEPEEEIELPDGPELSDPVAEGGSGLRFALYAVLFILIGGVGGGWLYFHMEAEREQQKLKELMFLENLGGKLVEARRWNEARLAFGKIDVLAPESEIALRGQRSIEYGMRQEQEQFVGYWSGEALAAFEAGRLEDAGAAADKVLERYPKERTVIELRERISTERKAQIRVEWSEKVRGSVEKRDWATAADALAGITKALPEDELIAVLGREILDGKALQQKQFDRARELASAAKLRDQGKFDAEALEWMREAVALAPDDEAIRALYEKLASYSRTLRVPEDYPTLTEALAEARDRDRVVLGEGTYPGGQVVNVAVQLEGLGEGKTVLEAPAATSPALTFGPRAVGASVSGIVFRHEGFDAASNRFPVVQVRAGELTFSNCEFREGSGHGLEVIEGGKAEAVRCDFVGNGWDGMAARGKGSRMVARECRSTANYGHGYEVWDGARASIHDCVAKQNCRNGILIDSASDALEIIGNEVMGNREYGVLLAAGASGEVSDNSCYANLKAGMLVRFASISVRVQKNRLEENLGGGLILEQGLRGEIYKDNVSRKNKGRDVVANAKFGGL